MKRLLSCTSSEMLKMDGQELKQAILASEGRTVMTETVVAIKLFRISVIDRRTDEVAKRADTPTEYPAIDGNADENKGRNRTVGERNN